MPSYVGHIPLLPEFESNDQSAWEFFPLKYKIQVIACTPIWYKMCLLTISKIKNKINTRVCEIP